MESHFLGRHSITNSLVKKLSDLLREPLFQKFDKIYSRAVKEYKSQGNYGYKSSLIIFQRLLEKIAKWDNRRKIREYERLIKSGVNKDYLKKLIVASHQVYLEEMQSKINVTYGGEFKCPSASKFIYECYKHIAREIWRKAFLFIREVQPIKRQRNLNEIYYLIDYAILNVIRNGIPLKEMLLAAQNNNSSFGGSSDEEVKITSESVSESESDPESKIFEISDSGSESCPDTNEIKSEPEPVIERSLEELEAELEKAGEAELEKARESEVKVKEDGIPIAKDNSFEEESKDSEIHFSESDKESEEIENEINGNCDILKDPIYGGELSDSNSDSDLDTLSIPVNDHLPSTNVFNELPTNTQYDGIYSIQDIMNTITSTDNEIPDDMMYKASSVFDQIPLPEELPSSDDEFPSPLLRRRRQPVAKHSKRPNKIKLTKDVESALFNYDNLLKKDTLKKKKDSNVYQQPISKKKNIRDLFESEKEYREFCRFKEFQKFHKKKRRYRKKGVKVNQKQYNEN